MTAMTSAPETRAGATRPRLSRGARRTQLLAAAQEVFVAQGYHAAAMDDIAERAGVSKPVLYQHFPGKLDLYLALLDQASAALLDDVHRALESTHDNKLRVAATVAAYFRYVEDDAGAFRLVFESDLTSEAAVRERVERMNAACASAVSELIAEDAGLDREEAMLLAMALVGMAQVSARYWLASAGSIPRDAAATLVSTLSWRGIRGFPHTGDGAPH
jgi:AcrR family transcriptional regulator